MSASWQLGALMKKNLILMKRGYISTLCEIFFPIILMILLVSLRKTIHIIDYNEPINDEDYPNDNEDWFIVITSQMYYNIYLFIIIIYN